ncbi:MAG: Sec-independent protein translocase protein TatB [Pseudomonadota bacterium]
MFDIGADELLVTAVVAIVVIGPKDLPRALRMAGRWIAKLRRMSNAFRAGIDNVIREAEMEELEQTWRERNAAIMARHPHTPGSADEDAIGAAGAAQGHVDPQLPHPLDVDSAKPRSTDCP